MSRHLKQITDWPGRAAAAVWCIATLAKHSHVSVSTLERHFHDAMRQCPRDWLNDERQRRARELLCDHTSVKETAILLGYKSQHHFSLAFRKYHGYPPKLHQQKMADGGWKMAGNGRQKAEGRSQISATTCRAEAGDEGKSATEAEHRTPDAGRRTPDAGIMPGDRWRFDEFKYKDDELMYITLLACN